MNERALIAYHEAGHAVAAVKRGVSSMQSVTISADDYRGRAGHLPNRWDSGFVAWAGPWAQARAEWNDRPLHETHEFVFHGKREFDDYLVGTCLADGHNDRQVVEQHFASLPWPSMRAGSEWVWGVELAAMWPAIELVAEWLLADEPVTDQRVRELIEQQ